MSKHQNRSSAAKTTATSLRGADKSSVYVIKKRLDFAFGPSAEHKTKDMADKTPSSVESAQHSSRAESTAEVELREDPGSPPSAPSHFLKHLPSSTATAYGDQASPADPPAESSRPLSSSKPQVDSQGRTLNPRSCVTCRRRKVKCDKIHPCSNCSRAHVECVFPSPGRAPRKSRKAGEGRDKELLERLRRLEGVVKGMGVEVPGVNIPDNGQETGDQSGLAGSNSAGASADAQRGATDTDGDGTDLENVVDGSRKNPGWYDKNFEEKTQFVEEQRAGRFENRFGRLVVNEGKSRYINNSFWANLSNEVEDLKGILNHSNDEDDEDSSPVLTSQSTSPYQSWIFGFNSQSADLLSLHPLPGQIQIYWETYKDRVDPLVKVLHIPTLEPTVIRAASNLSSLPRGFETLTFAIYYGATTSLSAEECSHKFGEEKSVLLARYRFGVEQALARANFLTSEETVVLQSFVIFLICLRRNCDARIIWTLTGLVVRIAQTIGVHRDGAHFGLTPFEIEMRRRLWWQVCILDTRASEDHGCDPTIIEQSFDTKMPLNINDVDLGPDMTDLPAERQGCTDMSFCLIRFEVANTFRRINYIPPGPPRGCSEYYASVTLDDKERWITECHQRLEDRYLKHCDMSVPIFWVTATVARLMMSKMWLMVYHPFQRANGAAELSKEMKEKLFITSLENIEYSHLLETESRTMKWGWLFKTYMQWHALAFILSELCRRTTGDLIDRAWSAVEKTRTSRWGVQINEDARAGHLWRPLKKLYRKARDARQRGLWEEQAGNRLGTPFSRMGRTCSPDATSTLDPPARPPMTRAPLSSAQLNRLTHGPRYGQVPFDKHDLLKSPSANTEDSGEGGAVEVRDDDMSGQQQQHHHHHHLLTHDNLSAGVPNSDIMNLPGERGLVPGIPEETMSGRRLPFSRRVMDPMDSIDFSGLPQQLMGHEHTSYGAGDDLNEDVDVMQQETTSLDGNSLRDRNTDDVDLSIMDKSGELDWDNWDQLVRQYVMDVDGMPSEGGPAMGDWSSVGTDFKVVGAGANGTGSRMGMNMSVNANMGMGDWF